MPLYSPENVRQPAIGQREHWNLFRRFQHSSLHTAFLSKLRPCLDHTQIDSRVTGRAILEAVRAESPHLLQTYHEEQLGGLFGMALWNLLAERPEDWRFYRMSDTWNESQWTTYFRPGESLPASTG